MSDTSPSPSPPEEIPNNPRLKVHPPGWSHPPEETSSPSPLDVTPEGGFGDASSDSPAPSDELPEPRSTKSGSSRGSSRVAKAQLREVLEIGIEGSTTLAHEHLTDDYAHAEGLYLADEDDVKDIAKPGSALLARRFPEVSEDLADGIALAIAVASYVRKQVNRWAVARQARRDAAELEQGAQYPDDEPPAVDTPFGPSPAGASPIRGGQS